MYATSLLVGGSFVDERPMIDGDWLRRLRERRGLSQEELAERSTLSQAMISRLERNLTIRRADAVNRIAKALGVPEADLTGGERRAIETRRQGVRQGARSSNQSLVVYRSVPLLGTVPAFVFVETGGTHSVPDGAVVGLRSPAAVYIGDDSLAEYQMPKGSYAILDREADWESGWYLFEYNGLVTLRRVRLEENGDLVWEESTTGETARRRPENVPHLGRVHLVQPPFLRPVH